MTESENNIVSELEAARHARSLTSGACANKPGDAALIEADNAAQANVHELELKHRTAEEAEQYGRKPHADL